MEYLQECQIPGWPITDRQMNLAKPQFAAQAVSLLGHPAEKASWETPVRAPEGQTPDAFTREISPKSSVEENDLARPEVRIPVEESRPGRAVEVCAHPAAQLSILFPAQDFITGHKFEVAHCVACGLTVTTPQPAAGEMANYYPCGYYGALADRRFPRIVEGLQEALYAHRVRQVESVAGRARGRVLDVGCGRGWLLQEFRRRGWEVQGTELS